MQNRSTLTTLVAIQCVSIIDFMMVMPLGPDFAESLNVPVSSVGVIGASYTAAAAVSGLIASTFLDRFERRRALTVAFSGLLLATFAASLTSSLEALLVARVIAGCFGGPCTSLVFAIASDVSPVAERGRAIGQVMVAFSVASVLGVPLGLEAARYGGWQAPFIALSVLGVIPLIFATRKLPVLAGHISQARVGIFAAMGLVRHEKYFLTLLMSFFAMAGAFLLIPNIAAIVQNNMGFPRHGMGLLYLGGGIISFFALSISGKMVDKAGSLLPSWIGTVLFILACLVGLGFELIYVPIAFTLFMVAMSMRNVSFSALSTKVPAPHERANFMSLLSAVQHIACALGAYGATLVLGTGENNRVLHVLELTVVATVLALSQPLLVARVEKLMKAG